jgi:hypothetical protein
MRNEGQWTSPVIIALIVVHVFLCAVGKNCIGNSVSYRSSLIFIALDMPCSAAISSSAEAL